MKEKRIALGIRKSWEDYNSDILNFSFGKLRNISTQVVYAYMFGHDDISLSIDDLSCSTITCTCNIYHPELFTYEWNCSSNLNIVEQNGAQISVVPLSSGSGSISVNVLSYGRVMYSKNITINLSTLLPTSLQPVSTVPLTITSNTEWTSTNMLLPTTLLVDAYATLTITGTLYNTPSARIIVHPGGKLIVDGGTLTSACTGEMWQGIEVLGDPTQRQLSQYQGTVELRNGATIENAHCAIRTGGRSDTVHYFTTGGIISAENTTFRNNRQSVVINSYAYTAPSGGIANYNATFSRCTLKVDNNNLFAVNNVAFT